MRNIKFHNYKLHSHNFEVKNYILKLKTLIYEFECANFESDIIFTLYFFRIEFKSGNL